MIQIISEQLEEKLLKICGRSELTLDRPEAKIVSRIIKDVRKRGDRAVCDYTRKFDHANIKELRVDPLEIKLAHQQMDPVVLKSIRKAIKNISLYHVRQIPKSWMVTAGKKSKLGLRYSPVSSAGVYVPGGRAVLVSSLLMNVIPAKLSGVSRICVATPPNRDGKIHSAVLAAAYELGIQDIYLCGGAQAIAALAYGTETIPKVDMIVGPGNIFVTLAKKLVYGLVGIDKLAGPSDSLIAADESANPKFIAADMITQAEHDPLASSMVICTTANLANRIKKELVKQVESLPRQEIIKRSFHSYGAVIVAEREKMPRLIDLVAPEHLQVMLKDPEEIVEKINNAGAIFIGNYSPEALGDYLAGPNHVLPTGGTARFSSPLGVMDFIKASSIINYSKEDLRSVQKDIDILTGIEGLQGHNNSVKIRF